MNDSLSQPFLNGSVEVGEEPVQVCTIGHGSSAVVANTGSTTVFLGGSSVVPDNGVPLKAGTSLTVWSPSNKSRSLFACSKSQGTIAYLSAG